jgi:hypothetical protein
MVQYRKSKKVGPLRFTVSQRGISASIGAGPLRISHGADGKVRRTVRVPGTGIYDTKVVGGTTRQRPPRPVSKFEATFMVIWLLAFALFVAAVFWVLAWACFSTGHWLFGIAFGVAPFILGLAVLGKIAQSANS